MNMVRIRLMRMCGFDGLIGGMVVDNNEIFDWLDCFFRLVWVKCCEVIL